MILFMTEYVEILCCADCTGNPFSGIEIEIDK